MIEFRKAIIDDIEQLTVLRQRQLQEAGAVPDTDISKNIAGYFYSAFEDNSFIAWVATVDNNIVSTCGISFQKKPPYYSNINGLLGEVCNVFTEKAYRRCGLAKSLLKHITNEAKLRGVTALRVSAAKAGEPLYENFGFSKADNFYIMNIKELN